MKTVGSILREAREAKGLTFDEIERAIKIRAKFLKAIEDDDVSSLPSQEYARAFVKNYSAYVGISERVILAFFRRQTKEAGRSEILPKGVARPIDRTLFQLTPGRFLKILITGFVVVFLGYLGVQYRAIRRPPVVVVDSPAEESVSLVKKVDVIGQTDPDATVLVNGISVLVRGDGKFFDQVTLEPGDNTITVIATSRYGKTTTATRNVTYQSEETNPR